VLSGLGDFSGETALEGTALHQGKKEETNKCFVIFKFKLKKGLTRLKENVR
jgi:hypothetical protein